MLSEDQPINIDEEIARQREIFDGARRRLAELNEAKSQEALTLLRAGLAQAEVIRRTKLTQPVIAKLAKKLRQEREAAEQQAA